MAKRTTRTYSVPSIVRTLSFVAVMIAGLGIAIGVVLGNWVPGAAAIGGWIKNIAVAIGLLALCWYSYYHARTCSTVWFVLWIIATILVIVFMVLGMVL